jgi:hypothetical protein
MSFLTPPPRRRRGGGRPASRFRRSSRPREEFAGRLVQALVMSVLAAALLMLLRIAYRMVRQHFAEEYGAQAWLLPITVGCVFIFILYRLQRIWTEVAKRARALKKASKSSADKDDASTSHD